MAKGKKTGGRNFEPGICPNPNGRPPITPEVKALRGLTHEHIKDVMDLLVDQEFEKLREMAKDTSLPALKLLYIRAVLRAVETGDLANIEIVLNRVLGKPKERIEHSGAITLESIIASHYDTSTKKD